MKKSTFNAILVISTIVFFISLYLSIWICSLTHINNGIVFGWFICFIIYMVFLEIIGSFYRNSESPNQEESERVQKQKEQEMIEKQKRLERERLILRYQNATGIEANVLSNEIKSVYPDFDMNSFQSSIKLDLDKLANKSIPREEALKMVATDNFINNYSNKLEFLDTIYTDNYYKTGNIRVVFFDKESKKIKVTWAFDSIVVERNARTGEIMKGLTRKIRRKKSFLVVRADNVKYEGDISHCPNCGAPLKYANDVECDHCNKYIKFANYWLLDEMLEE